MMLVLPAIDAPGGFLFEWWSVFWDIFIARTNEKHSEVAASYIEVSLRIFSCNYSLFGCTLSRLYVTIYMIGSEARDHFRVLLWFYVSKKKSGCGFTVLGLL